MIKVSLDEYSDGWAYAMQTGPTMRGLPSVGAALDGAVEWIESPYDRVERIIIDKVVTISRNGELWECDHVVTITRNGELWECDHNGYPIAGTSPGIAMVAAIEREWLGRDDHYSVRVW